MRLNFVRLPMRVSIGASAIAACLAACSGAAARPTEGPPVAVHPLGTGTPQPSVIGKFRFVGGPFPGVDRPLSGDIEIHRGQATGPVVGHARATSGRFTAALPAGRYVFVGRSPRVSGLGCRSYPTNTVRAGRLSRVTVQCDVP